MKVELMRVGNKHWPLIKRSSCSGGWDHGIRRWSEWLKFRGFKVLVSYSEKDNPRMFKGKDYEGIIKPGYLLEIDPPNRARYSGAGELKVKIFVYKVTDENDPPLTLEEIKETGEIIDALEGRKGVMPRKSSPNPKGAEPKYNPDDVMKIYERWEKAGCLGRISKKVFYEQNEDLNEKYTLKKLRLILDRGRQIKKSNLDKVRRKA